MRKHKNRNTHRKGTAKKKTKKNKKKQPIWRKKITGNLKYTLLSVEKLNFDSLGSSAIYLFQNMQDKINQQGYLYTNQVPSDYQERWH